MKAIVQEHFHQLRFLLHSLPEKYSCPETLYIASQNNSVWSRVASKVLEPWRIVPSVLAERIPRHLWSALNIQEILPQNLIKELKPESLTEKDLPTKEERKEVLDEIAKKPEYEWLWKGLTLHEATNGRLVSITEITYRENPEFPLYPELRAIVTLIRETNRKDWIPMWTPKAALQIGLKQPEPQRYSQIFLGLIPQIKEVNSDQEFLKQLKKIPWLRLKNGKGIAPERVILLPTHLKNSFTLSLQDTFDCEKVPYITSDGLDISIPEEAIDCVCKTWYENDILEFLLKDTSQPSKYVHLILNLLDIFEQRRQTISNANLNLLKMTLWLKDRKGQPRSPKYVIYAPAIESTATEILEKLTDWKYVTPSMLHIDLNIRKNDQLKSCYTSGEDAFEALGEAIAEQPQYYLGELPEERSLLDELIPIFYNCPEMSVLVLASCDIDAFEVFIFPKVLKPIQDITKVCRILNWLATTYDPPHPPVVKLYNNYLTMACCFNNFGSDILPKIQLLNQITIWESPEKLCDGKVHHEIDRRYVLDDSQRGVLSSYLDNLSRTNNLENYPINNPGSISNNFEHGSSNTKKLEEYFKPWLASLPSQAIGGFVCLLAGSDKELQHLAQSYLQRRPFEDVQSELIWEGLRNKRFNIKINSGQVQPIKSIIGKYFDAPISDSSIPRTIFVGELSQNITLKKIDLNNVTPDRLKDLLINSIKQFIRTFDRSGYEAKERLIENVWKRLNEHKQLEIEIARDFILKGSRYVLRTLGVNNSKIIQQLKNWEDQEFILSDWGKRSHRNDVEYHNILKKIQKISTEIESLIQGDTDIQKEVLLSVRKKIGQYGYHLNNIIFELFQNADDAVKELRLFIEHIPLERQYYVIKWDKNRIIIMHWGRPINQFFHPDQQNRNFRDQGFDRDLIKMLSFNISDKSNETTGKFGLGFKTVHLVTKQPRIVSGDLSFIVCGGVLPVSITDIGTLEELRTYLDEEKLSSEITDGTIIDLPIDSEIELESEEILREFRQQANLLLVFAKEIRKCKLIDDNFPHELDWSFTNVLGIAEIEYGQIRMPNQSGKWLAYKLLCFRLSAGIVAIVLPGNSLQGQSPLKDITPFWVTTPTQEDSGLRFIINGSFDVTTGRTRLDPNSIHNHELIQQLGKQLGDKLCQLFKNSAEGNWSSLERILDLKGVDAYRFWEFIWEVLATDWLNKSSDGTVTNLLKIGFGGLSNGMGALISSYAALPNKLCHQLVCLKDVRYEVRGFLAESKIFAKVASWKQFQQTYSTAHLVQHITWRYVQNLLESDSKMEVQSLWLSDCLGKELGNHHITPDTANQLGQLITPNQLCEWKDGHQEEYNKIYSILIDSSVYFESESRKYFPARQLLIKDAENNEERALAAFAPNDRLLSSNYYIDNNHALQFFLTCREQRDTVDIEELVQWAREANTKEQKLAVQKYLLSGERRGMFVNQLKNAIAGTWMENYDGFQEIVKINDQQARAQQASEGKLAWSKVFDQSILDDEDIGIDDDEIIDEQELLQQIYKWWQANHQVKIKQYNKQLYPINIEDLQQGLQNNDRSAWLMLFFIGATHTMGRTKHEQHRDFVQFCIQKNWWNVFSELDPQEYSEQWIDVLNRYLDSLTIDTQWYYWMEKYPSIYQIAKYLDKYRDSYLRADRIRRHFDLNDLTNPRLATDLSGGGVDAPPLRIGIGANFVIRELVRLELINPTEYVLPHCFVPRANVRRIMMQLGCHDLQNSNYAYSRQIYQFLEDQFSKLEIAENPIFQNCFDIPFELYISENPDLDRNEFQVKDDVGWYEDISDE